MKDTVVNNVHEKNRSAIELIKLIIAMVMLGTNGLFVVHLPFSSETIVVIRTGLGALFLWFVSLLIHRFDVQALRKDFFWATLGGVTMALNWLFLFEAFKEASVSVSILLCYCGPMLLLLLSPIIFHESLTKQILLAGLSVAVGMVCITGTDEMMNSTSIGMLNAIVSGVFYALLLVCNKGIKFMASIHCTLYQLVIATIAICIYSLLMNGTLPIEMPVGVEWIDVFVLGFVNTGLAYLLFFSAIKKLRGQTVALISYIEPLTALLVSAIFLGERLLAIQLLGAAFILGGTALGNLKKDG